MINRTEPAEHAVSMGAEHMVSFLGRQEWLDRPSYRIEHMLSFVFNALGGGRDRVMNALNGVWLGHPVHPPLASLSSGVIAMTVALDVMTITSDEPSAGTNRIAKYTLGLGILANLGAAATGVTDWQHTHEKERRIGLVHGLLNTAATALYAVSWNYRRRGRHARGAVASLVGYAISTGSGYLGGSLVFGSGIGTDKSGPRLTTTTWTPVLSEGLLPAGQLRHVEAHGVGLVVCRDGDTVSAVGQYCPHLAAPMADGWLHRGRIVCPWHGSQFDIDTGRVLRGPATIPLPCYEARITNGNIEVRANTIDSSDTEDCPAVTILVEEYDDSGKEAAQ